MVIRTAIALAVLVATIAGCSAQNAYDGVRLRQGYDCQKLQGVDREECSRRSDVSYDEYQNRLKERD
jgi:hypothetical protein